MQNIIDYDSETVDSYASPKVLFVKVCAKDNGRRIDSCLKTSILAYGNNTLFIYMQYR